MQLSKFQAERSKILVHEVDPRAFKNRLEYILYNFQKSEPIRQREVLRSILSRIEIVGDTQVQIKWFLSEDIILKEPDQNPAEKKSLSGLVWWGPQYSRRTTHMG